MRTQFITDTQGRKLSVILSIKDYQKMLEDLEELEDIRLYDASRAEQSDTMPAEKAFQMLDAKRKGKA
ncbi:MAG: hypothetical protein KKA07_17255 [Bacteroidetes bacterium]|nr:hypothetical protein [Bacteroidota bacterium]